MIQEYILRNWSLVRIGTTAAQKKLFFKLRRAKDQIKAIEGGDLSPEEVETIAQRLDVPVGDVIAMNRRLAEPDSSLDAPIKPGGEISGGLIGWPTTARARKFRLPSMRRQRSAESYCARRLPPLVSASEIS